MKPNRSTVAAPDGLTRLTKATLADLLWLLVVPADAATEESGWGAIGHAAKELGQRIPPQDRLTLRTLARIRRNKPQKRRTRS